MPAVGERQPAVETDTLGSASGRVAARPEGLFGQRAFEDAVEAALR